MGDVGVPADKIGQVQQPPGELPLTLSSQRSANDHTAIARRLACFTKLENSAAGGVDRPAGRSYSSD
jgi:hypothetical protein